MADSNIVFSKEHRMALQDLLWPARAQYKNIYIALGFDPADLDGGDRGTSVYGLYITVIGAIVKNCVSKQRLVDALKSQMVGHGQLARKLEQDQSIKDGKNGFLDASDNVIAQVIQFLYPAAAQCRAIVLQFNGVDPDALSTVQQEPFEIMLNQIVYDKQVTPKELADALQSPLVGHGQLAKKILKYDFSSD